MRRKIHRPKEGIPSGSAGPGQPMQKASSPYLCRRGAVNIIFTVHTERGV